MDDARRAGGASGRLTAQMVKQLSTPGLHHDGDGLYLQVTVGRDRPRKSWLLRYTPKGGKRREMGLGRADVVKLADVREKARKAREAVAAGQDPLAEKAARRREAAAAESRSLAFRDAVDQYLALHRATWRSAKHAAQWTATLETYANPVLGDMPVGQIDAALILKVLKPIWTEKPETASRLRGRIEAILDWCKVGGHRDGENPARWKGHLALALPARAKLQPVRHHSAVPVDDMPGLWAKLSTRTGAGVDCLQFAVLTAARSGEVRGATWAEIDFKKATWTVPAGRMKAKKEHRVPVGDQALAILARRASAGGTKRSGLIFSSDLHPQRALSDMTLGAVLKRIGRSETTHGFRSTFRDWAAERTTFPREVAEMALAHSIGSAVEAAYRRSDLFEKRRALMQAWGMFCTSAEDNDAASAVPPPGVKS